MEEEIKDGTTTNSEQTNEGPGEEAQEAVNADEPQKQEEVKEEVKEEEQPKEEVELALPDGSKLPQSRADEIATYAKEQGLSQEVAQKILAEESAALDRYEESAKEQLTELRKKWVEELKSDKQFGGANFDKTVQLAQRTIKKFATPELVDVLNRTGYGDNKDLIVTFAKIGAAFSEDTLVGRGVIAPDRRPKSLEERLYPNHKE